MSCDGAGRGGRDAAFGAGPGAAARVLLREGEEADRAAEAAAVGRGAAAASSFGRPECEPRPREAPPRWPPERPPPADRGGREARDRGDE
ncbi:MAG: hypothetical protein D6702_08770, partial [Planctomycetota bacterium]